MDDPNQAGEGPLPEEYEDPQVGEQLLLNSGMPYMVAALLASGAGPAAESSVPYRGREERPEAWIITQEPEAWVRNYVRFNIEKTKPVQGAEFLPAALRPPAPMTEEELRAEAERALKKKGTVFPLGCSGKTGCWRTRTGFRRRWFCRTRRTGTASVCRTKPA